MPCIPVFLNLLNPFAFESLKSLEVFLLFLVLNCASTIISSLFGLIIDRIHQVKMLLLLHLFDLLKEVGSDVGADGRAELVEDRGRDFTVGLKRIQFIRGRNWVRDVVS